MIGDCECCGFEGVEVKVYPPSTPRETENINLCEVCAGSYISNAMTYHYDNEMLYRALGYCTNLILKAIREK